MKVEAKLSRGKGTNWRQESEKRKGKGCVGNKLKGNYISDEMSSCNPSHAQ